MTATDNLENQADTDADLPRTFTAAEHQAELDRVAGRTRSEAKKQAEAAIAEQLGRPIAEVKALLDAAAKAEDATKSETQKALDAATAAQAAAETSKREAARDRLTAKIERKLAKAGVDEKAMTRAHRLVTVDLDADDDTIDAEIEALRDDMPALFAPAADDDPNKPKPPPPPAGTGRPKPPAGGQAVTTALERGRELARTRHPQPSAA